ncbi:hypothetical protein [Crateriforma conspicua]|uniref:Uncharacterized protein n=1 Tax=Crateriforma conspicua TaxID=2527996 RepID=A0A5C5Y8A9_9PLAN|nr:hypothetical protein [Crateriforma conspicua]TWT71906.1 hypothetical protein Pan14r_42230 [Crateriforma conspicua]
MTNPDLRLYQGDDEALPPKPDSTLGHDASPTERPVQPTAIHDERETPVGQTDIAPIDVPDDDPPRLLSDADIRRLEKELDRVSGTAEAKTVSVSVKTLMPLLMEAAENGRSWLHDFADDPVRIDADLYDVLLAYQQLSRRRAS